MSIPHAFKPLGVTAGDLPARYRRLDYLQNVFPEGAVDYNSQYINTGITWSADLDWSIQGVFEYINEWCAWGGAARRNVNYLTLTARPGVGLMGIIWGKSQTEFRTTINTYTPFTFDLSQTNGVLLINGIRITLGSQEGGPFAHPLLLFSGSVDGVVAKARHSLRLYRSTFYRGGKCIQDLIPAFDKEGQKPCLFDLVTQRAFYNAGPGEFIYA